MSNGHNDANYAMVTDSNGIPFPLTNLLHYVNLFFRKRYRCYKLRYQFFARTATVLGGNGWGLVINGNCNGWERKPETGATAVPIPLKMAVAVDTRCCWRTSLLQRCTFGYRRNDTNYFITWKPQHTSLQATRIVTSF